MSEEQFVYWLQGFFEIQNPSTINEKQTEIIKDHLSLVFNKITPNRYNSEKELTLIEDNINNTSGACNKKYC